MAVNYGGNLNMAIQSKRIYATDYKKCLKSIYCHLQRELGVLSWIFQNNNARITFAKSFWQWFLENCIAANSPIFLAGKYLIDMFTLFNRHIMAIWYDKIYRNFFRAKKREMLPAMSLGACYGMGCLVSSSQPWRKFVEHPQQSCMCQWQQFKCMTKLKNATMESWNKIDTTVF